MTRSLLTLFVLCACEPTIPDGPGTDPCVDVPTFTDLYAVELYATSVSGEPLVGAVGRYRVDDDPWLDCTAVDAQRWLCGADITGPITVQVEAPGHEPAQLTPVVAEDACGDPDTRRVDLVLNGAPCPPGVVPGVEAAVYGHLVDTYVAWHFAAEDGPWDRCDYVEGRPPRFACAMNQTGQIEVGAFTEGVLVGSQVVDVPLSRDRCFPVTQVVAFDLE